jgi:RNA polymerase sigma factor (sigma-70 family)
MKTVHRRTEPMPRSPAAALRRIATRSVPPDASDRDPELLRAFLVSRCEVAFAELVQRHGPMVLAVARRILGDTHDSEDAFQATFLVLARKAGTVRGANLAGWLYRVAVRSAQGVRVVRNRRSKLEAAIRNRRRDSEDSRDVPSGEASERQDLVAILDDELDRLPEHYRLAVVLCELQGRSRKEAAAELNIPEGTLSSRLATAKRKLAERLTRRGVTASAAAVTAALADHATARVPAELVRIATGSLSGSVVAARAAADVVKSMFVAQLKGVLVVVGLAAALSGVGILVAGGARGAARAAADEPKSGPVDPAAGLVRQLGDPSFATRESAGAKLRALGAKARPALEAAVRDPDPEVTRRSRALLAAIREDALAAFMKQFDPRKSEEYDHPVWKRYVAIAGDSRASRELFARIMANGKWLRTLDKAEADPMSAPHVYRVGIAEVFRDFDRDPAPTPEWPCNRGEEVAYLLLLGSYPDPSPPAKLEGDEIPPKSLRNTTFLGRGIICGEGQITHARGLALGLQGELLDTSKGVNAPAVAGAPGTDRVFARLLAAWLVRRDPSSEVVPPAFRIASMQRVLEIVPIARRYAANDFEPRREVPPTSTIAALELVARVGKRADLPLFERHFGDETQVATVAETRNYQPLPPPYTTQLRDVALGLALLLHGGNPEDFGFFVRKGAIKQTAGRYEIPWHSHFQLGFDGEASRTEAFAKAKAWLATQKP